MLIAITRDVSPSIAQCELTHVDRSPIDLERAQAQHRAYQRTLSTLGCRVLSLEAEPEMPDAVFVEDVAVVLDEMAIMTRPGAASRRDEGQAVAQLLQRYRPLHGIHAPGTLDGGDVLRVGRNRSWASRRAAARRASSNWAASPARPATRCAVSRSATACT